MLVSTVRAVANQLGNPGGVVNIDVSLKGLTEIVKQIKLGESGYLMLVESNGNVRGRWHDGDGRGMGQAGHVEGRVRGDRLEARFCTLAPEGVRSRRS